jgi:endonuclease YncB( thermonuclease family)
LLSWSHARLIGDQLTAILPNQFPFPQTAFPDISFTGIYEACGLVVAVTDGDTIDLVDEQHASYRIRLQGIDAPEKQQAFYNVARHNLANLVAGKKVLVEWQKHDQYGRIVGKVFFDNQDVCLEQIKAGLAWHYKQFEDEQSEVDRLLYARAEEGARSQKLGLWRDSTQIEPWEFRHHHLVFTSELENETTNAIRFVQHRWQCGSGKQ